MIKKLYKLKKTQVDQVIAQKLRLLNRTYEIDNEIKQINNHIINSNIQKQGIMSNILYLNAYKSRLTNNIKALIEEKNNILEHIKTLELQIVELNQECEQYEYMLNLEKKEAFKKMLKDEANVSEEYIQSKLIANKKEAI